MRVILTIAGTDPTSAAGIQADVQVIRDFGHHGASVITAVLAQNTQGVQRCDPVDAPLLQAQLDAVFDDLDVAAVKVGLVPTASLVALVAETLRPRGLPVVWDPVVASGDARTTLYDGTPAALRLAADSATLLTPNIPELAWLTGTAIDDLDDAIAAAATLPTAVLIKAGHLPHANLIQDVLVRGDSVTTLAALPVVDFDARGTGCHLSTAIACALADGEELHIAVERARHYLNERLRHAVRLGRGRPLLTVRQR